MSLIYYAIYLLLLQTTTCMLMGCTPLAAAAKFSEKEATESAVDPLAYGSHHF